MIARRYMSVGALEKAQPTADDDNSVAGLQTEEEPALVEQLAARSATGWCDAVTPLART